MSLKYKCPECGEPLGYEGLCWKCRARHHRKAVESWTDEELEEKINQVVERLKNLEDKEFYQTDECDTFYDLMTRGINIEKISEVACEEEIYYPSELYYKANEKVRDRLRKKILGTESSGEGAELLGCLAMIGDKVAQDTLYELKIHQT